MSKQSEILGEYSTVLNCVCDEWWDYINMDSESGGSDAIRKKYGRYIHGPYLIEDARGKFQVCPFCKKALVENDIAVRVGLNLLCGGGAAWNVTLKELKELLDATE